MLGLVINEFIELEIASTAPATADGNARHAGMLLICTFRLPGPGFSGGPLTQPGP